MEDFEDEDVDTNDNDSGEARKWRARGVVGKLHNIVLSDGACSAEINF